MGWLSNRSKKKQKTTNTAKKTNDFVISDDKQDFFYLETLPEDMSQQLWAKIATVMNYFKNKESAPAIIDGGFGFGKVSRFMRYRDKEKLFLPPTSYHNFYTSLHNRGSISRATATFGSEFTKELTPKHTLGTHATRYVDQDGQTAIKVERDDQERVQVVSYFRDGKLRREDSYDHQGRLMMTERFAEMPNIHRQNATDPFFVTTSVQRMLVDMSGRPVIVALPTFNQFWVESESGEPIKALDDEAELMVWWLLQNFQHTNRKLYIDADSDLFAQLIDEPAMHPHLVPIVYDKPDTALLANVKSPAYLISQQFVDEPGVKRLAGDVLPILSWHEYMPH